MHSLIVMRTIIEANILPDVYLKKMSMSRECTTDFSRACNIGKVLFTGLPSPSVTIAGHVRLSRVPPSEITPKISQLSLRSMSIV